ncbi:N-acetyltransferase [Cerasibacillus terrae]|uniref:N-acetyltransferase n=1 Tax=Cerasibacillus terrae TaxID=2498845 RepID=A0A5C8NXD8_9BACI|nr:GNAT family N-acetyltransferase [Cerasibacillus terrae]TXL65784.1 N-acetyltransferase [Cerasibacillus terrae]
MHTIKKGTNQLYIGDTEEEAIAKITFIPEGDKLIANHTFVSEQLRGQGIAKKLTEELVAHAKEENKKIVPECSYVEVFMKRYKEHQAVFVK